MPLSSQVSVYVGIDWTLTGVYVDESQYVRTLQTQRGRSSSNDAPAPGTGSVVLSNASGRFSPFNTASTLYPNVLPGRPCIIEITYNAVTYPHFKGYATPTFPTRGMDSRITLNLVDEFDKWSKPPLTNTDLSTDALISDLMIEILDDIGFDLLAREIDTSENALAFWTNHNRLPLNGLRLLANENMGGLVFMRPNGDFRFENMTHRSMQPVYATLAGTFDAIAPEIRFDDLVDRVRVLYPRFTVTSDLQAAYSLNPTGKILEPGLTTFVVDFAGLGVSGAVSPVAVTDYTANTVADGTGTDKTAQVLVDSFTSTGGGATVVLNNIDSLPSYLTYFQIRALIVQEGNEQGEIEVNTSAPLIDFSKFERTFDFQTDVVDLTSYAEYQAERLGHLTVRIPTKICPDTDALMALVLGADISKRVALSDVGAPWLTQIDGDFFIEQIGIQLDAQNINKVYCNWLLMDERLGEGDGFIVNDDAPINTWPDSFIADDADLVGKVIFK